MTVRAVLAWAVCRIFTLGSSHNLLRKKWHISATLLLFFIPWALEGHKNLHNYEEICLFLYDVSNGIVKFGKLIFYCKKEHTVTDH